MNSNRALALLSIVTVAMIVAILALIRYRGSHSEVATAQAATETPTPKPTIEVLGGNSYPGPTGWAASITAPPRPTHRAMSAGQLAERYRFSTSIECDCQVTIETVREYDSNDSGFLSTFISPARIADLPNSGSVVLVVVRRDDQSLKPYQAVLTHRDKGGLVVVESPNLAKILDRFPTPVP